MGEINIETEAARESIQALANRKGDIENISAVIEGVYMITCPAFYLIDNLDSQMSSVRNQVGRILEDIDMLCTAVDQSVTDYEQAEADNCRRSGGEMRGATAPIDIPVGGFGAVVPAIGSTTVAIDENTRKMIDDAAEQAKHDFGPVKQVVDDATNTMANFTDEEWLKFIDAILAIVAGIVAIVLLIAATGATAGGASILDIIFLPAAVNGLLNGVAAIIQLFSGHGQDETPDFLKQVLEANVRGIPGLDSETSKGVADGIATFYEDAAIVDGARGGATAIVNGEKGSKMLEGIWDVIVSGHDTAQVGAQNPYGSDMELIVFN